MLNYCSRLPPQWWPFPLKNQRNTTTTSTQWWDLLVPVDKKWVDTLRVGCTVKEHNIAGLDKEEKVFVGPYNVTYTRGHSLDE
jgi:hypothetical protein